MAPFTISREEKTEFGKLSGTSATLAVIAILLAGSVILVVIVITSLRTYHLFVRNGGFARVLHPLTAGRQARRGHAHQDNEADNEADNETYHANHQYRLAVGLDHYPNSAYPIPLQYNSVGPVNPQPVPGHAPAAGYQDPLNNRGNHEIYRAAFPSSQLNRVATVPDVRPGISVLSITPPLPPPYSTDSEESGPETPTRPRRVQLARRLRHPRSRRSSRASRRARSVQSHVDF